MPTPTLILYGSLGSPVVKRILERLKKVSKCVIDLRDQPRIKCPVAILVDPKYKVRLHASGEDSIVDMALGESCGRKLISTSS